ncbi:MAG: hypothetical protein HC854_13685 [Flavobacterium sp.]|nr:hypothetical protein [Flavobacterium sp.]
MSENLVSGYTHNYNNISDNATFDYVFNEKNQIVKEVVTKSSTYFPLFKSESTYEYK